MIPVNYKQLGYRIGTSDRPLGEPTPNPEGFLVLNQTNGKVFKVCWSAPLIANPSDGDL